MDQGFTAIKMGPHPPGSDKMTWGKVVVEAARQQWHIRMAERYPQGRGVAKYLARSVRGGPSKDHRLVSFEQQQVTFW